MKLKINCWETQQNRFVYQSVAPSQYNF